MGDWRQTFREPDGPLAGGRAGAIGDPPEDDEMTEEDLLDGLVEVAMALPESVTSVRVKPPCIPCAEKARKGR
jgi:hypothetical protein